VARILSTRVVHQKADVEIARFTEDPPDSRMLRQIGNDDSRAAVELAGDVFEPFDPTRNQDHAEPLRRMLPGKLSTDCGRCAGDDSPLSISLSELPMSSDHLRAFPV
jgi:hypothetical protein